MKTKEDWVPNAVLLVLMIGLGGAGLSDVLFKPKPAPALSATPDIVVQRDGPTDVFTIEDGGKIKPDVSIGFLLDNSGSGPDVFPVNCNGAKECFHIMGRAYGEQIFFIRDGDEPQGPGCDFGLLVRLAKQDYRDHHSRDVFVIHDGGPGEAVPELAEQLQVCSPKESRTR